MKPARSDESYMRLALRLAARARGETSPNPMVGAVLVKAGRIIGRGWHHRAGAPHAEIEALRAAAAAGLDPAGATLYVTLEPCTTHGRTPPCSDAIKAARVARVVVGATDPNPAHAGRAFTLLRRAGIQVTKDILGGDAAKLNAAFNHWIVHRTPWVTIKAAMTLDGKVATSTGESKWITGEVARAEGMRLRQDADAILVGIETVLADYPSLTWRPPPSAEPSNTKVSGADKRLRRIILDSRARTPLSARLVTDEHAALTTIVVTAAAPARRVAALARRVNVLRAPTRGGRVDLRWLMRRLGREEVTSLLVEGGGEVNAAFLAAGLARRVAFFYAPKVLGGRAARKAVAGEHSFHPPIRLTEITWRRLGPDLFMTATIAPSVRISGNPV